MCGELQNVAETARDGVMWGEIVGSVEEEIAQKSTSTDTVEKRKTGRRGSPYV